MIEASSPATLRGWLDHGRGRLADKVLVHSIDQGKSITYAQMHDVAGRIGAYLRQAGFAPGERVALLANNSIEHLAVYFGVMAYGATICTIHVEANAAHLGEILASLRPRLVLYQEGLDTAVPIEGTALGEWRADGGAGFFAALPQAPPAGLTACDAGTSDNACIFFTSGTSARPKGVVVDFKQLLDNVVPTAQALAMTQEDRLLDFRSYNWASAQILSALAPLAVGASVVMAGKFSRSRFFAWIREHRATITAGNPTTLNMLTNGEAPAAAAGLPSLRFVLSSSAPLGSRDWRRFEERFAIKVVQGYGASEAGWIAGGNENTVRRGSAGRPLPYHQLRIVDESGTALPAGQTGLVELGDDRARKYRTIAEDGAIVVDATGRLRTGDIGYLDDDGYLFLTGRKKDLIVRGGVNIAPAEIDAVLLRHGSVAEAAAIGVPDEIYGEEVVAYISLAADAELGEAALLEHCAKHLPDFKAPKAIAFIDAMPRNARGKLDRRALTEAWGRQAK
jgi:acyl-coenzyme A synthetase/AMP-(fatty) acid ligase